MSMPSERVQRQIDRLLDQAEEAIGRQEWTAASAAAQAVLGLDASNEDALAFSHAIERALAVVSAPVPDVAKAALTPSTPAVVHQPTSFCNGRYQVKSFLGEGGKKRVYLAFDSLLDRDVAFALIKTDGLDDV